MKKRRSPVSSDKRFKKNKGFSFDSYKERLQHSEYKLERTDNISVALKILNDTVLDILESKKIIDEKQFSAGIRFRSDFYSGDVAARVLGSYSGMRNDTNFYKEHEKSENQELAYERWRKAVKELGLMHGKLVISSICYEKMPLYKEIEALQEGLTKLAKVYRC